MIDESNRKHRKIADEGLCLLCKFKFNILNLPVRDHKHLNGQYRGIVRSNCNLKMQKPNFVSYFFIIFLITIYTIM